MTSVRQIMTGVVITASPDESVARAARRMQEMHVGGLPVVDGDGRLVGILTSRDVRLAHPNRLVADAMTRQVITLPPQASVWEAAAVMERHRIERLPVVEGDRLVGLVTHSQVQAALGRLTDALTGLPTSTYLRYTAEKLLASGHEICLIFLDIDDFGAVNKRLGHVYGDRCLKDLARVLQSCCRPDADYPCRYGGDEFAIVTLRPAAEAARFARGLIDAITRSLDLEGMGLSVSAGLVEGRRRPARNQDLGAAVDNLINLASRASTEAKRAHAGVLLLDVSA